jgi:4-hydroxy-tetrahydrodipicolinate synthase
MTEPLFRGAGVALVTLFDDDGSVDAAATADLAVRLVALGVSAVVVAGSTGEATALDPDERARLISTVRHEIESCGHRVPLIAGTGAPSTRQACKLTAQAREAGADAVLVLSPPGSSDLHSYYASVRESAGGIPLLGYHFPSVSSPGIGLAELSSLPIDGCKDSSGDAGRMLDTLSAFDRPLYVGSAALLALAGPIGCTGAILALANAEPELCVAAFGGDADAQLRLGVGNRRATARFPAGIKELTAERFGTSTARRLG